ncbi:hypothetical protein Tco_0004026 [Tanacetum coccineum]
MCWMGSKKQLLLLTGMSRRESSECVFSEVKPLLIQLTLVTPGDSVIANSIPELLNIDSWYCRRGGKRSEEVGLLQNICSSVRVGVATASACSTGALTSAILSAQSHSQNDGHTDRRC